MILPVGSPWPLLLCRRKKSLLLSVTHSFRAFFSRTSSGFSHISSSGEGPGRGEALRRLGLRGECFFGGVFFSPTCPPAREFLHPRVLVFVHVYPRAPTAAGCRAHRLASSPTRPIDSSCTRCTRSSPWEEGSLYEKRWRPALRLSGDYC